MAQPEDLLLPVKVDLKKDGLIPDCPAAPNTNREITESFPEWVRREGGMPLIAIAF